MKIMLKKCMALVIAIFMMSASMAVFAAEDTTAPVQTTLTEAQIEKYNKDFSFLKAVGIWRSPMTDPAQNVTRGEFASVMAGFCNLDNAVALNYSDVNEETQYASDIYAVGWANLMVGSDNAFRPEAEITYNQAAKTIVCALGYEAIANSKGGYPDGYYAVAMDLGLTVGRGRDEAMTRYDVATLLAKACDVEVMNVIGVDDDNKLHFEIDKENDALAVYHGVYELEGKLTDDGVTSIKGASACPGNNVIIAGKKLTSDGVSADGLLGLNVIAYYEAETDKLLYVTANDEKNEILVINAADLVIDSEKFTKTNVVYEKGKRTDSAKISPYADFIYNGSAYPAFMVNDIKIKAGKLTLIDNNFDNIYDIVVAEEFVNMIVKTNNQKSQILADEHGNELRYEEYDKFELVSASGESKKPSQIKINSVLSVFESKDGKRVKVIVSDTTVVGKISALSTDEDGKDVVTITSLVESEEVNTDLEYSATFVENSTDGMLGFKKPAVNTEVTARLDFEGRIAGFEAYEEQYEYAYFIAAGKDTSSQMTSKMEIKIVTDEGDLVVITTAKKIKINGVSTENADDILAITDLYVDGNINGDFLRQVIKVKVNALGELKEIETTNSASKCTNSYGFDLTRFCIVYENATADFYSAPRLTYNANYKMNEDTTIFLIPTEENYDPQYIRVVKPEKLYDYARKAAVKMYDSDQHWTVGAAEVRSNATSGYFPQSMVVTKCVQGINSNGEDIYMVTGWYKSEMYTLREERPGLIDAAVPSGLQFGDIIGVKADDEFDIIDVELRVRTSEAGPTYSVDGNIDTGSGYFYGHIYARSKDTITLSHDNGLSVRGHILGNYSNPVILDYENKEVRFATWDEFPVCATVNADGTFTFSDNGTMCYLYKDSGYTSHAVLVIK